MTLGYEPYDLAHPCCDPSCPSCLLPAVSQAYVTVTNDAHVIVGNSALLKCEIPSFVADFVTVESWADNEGGHYHKKSGDGAAYGKYSPRC